MKPASRARSRRKSVKPPVPVEVLEEEVKREDDEDGEHTPPRADGDAPKDTSSERKKKLVYLPYLLPASDKNARNLKGNEDIEHVGDEEPRRESLKKAIDPAAAKKPKHHKSKDKCPICIAKRAKREAERKEREQQKQASSSIVIQEDGH